MEINHQIINKEPIIEVKITLKSQKELWDLINTIKASESIYDKNISDGHSGKYFEVNRSMCRDLINYLEGLKTK